MCEMYFAYGANTSCKTMTERCPSAFALPGVATLEHFDFLINIREVATIIPDEGKHVEGLLWKVTEEDLQRLDRYEGVDKGYYCREMREVTNSDGDQVKAWVYIASDHTPGRPRPNYLSQIIHNGERLGFSQGYVARLKRHLTYADGSTS